MLKQDDKIKGISVISSSRKGTAAFVSPKLLYCHIWTIFNKNTKTCICDRGTIEFVERERIQDIFIHISFFTLTKSKGRELIIAEIYNKKC